MTPPSEKLAGSLDALRSLQERRIPPCASCSGTSCSSTCIPTRDGNGRIGRFLMNFLLTAAGYPWTVIPVERRDTYMAALEEPSVRQDIGPFTDLLAGLVGDG